MRPRKELFFYVSSVHRTKSKFVLNLSGKIKKGRLEIGQRVFFFFGTNYVECFVAFIWSNGKKVSECHAGKAAIVSIKSDVSFEILNDLTNTDGWHLCRNIDKKNNNDKATVFANSAAEANNCYDSQVLSGAQEVSDSKNNSKDSKGELLTDCEKEYVKNLRCAVYRGGYLSPTEVYVLDKIRIALGLETKRAEELELKYISRIPNNKVEHDYYDAVAACLLDCNYISDSERDLLSNLRGYLRISEARAAEIEKLADWDNYLE